MRKIKSVLSNDIGGAIPDGRRQDSRNKPRIDSGRRPCHVDINTITLFSRRALWFARSTSTLGTRRRLVQSATWHGARAHHNLQFIVADRCSRFTEPYICSCTVCEDPMSTNISPSSVTVCLVTLLAGLRTMRLWAQKWNEKEQIIKCKWVITHPADGLLSNVALERLILYPITIR